MHLEADGLLQCVCNASAPASYPASYPALYPTLYPTSYPLCLWRVHRPFLLVLPHLTGQAQMVHTQGGQRAYGERAAVDMVRWHTAATTASSHPEGYERQQ
jgi:hypothetical protein